MSRNKEERKTIPIWLQSMITGSIAGGTEVLVDHPLWTVKTLIQSNQALTFNPRTLYRGILPNAASMIPITATQVTLNSGFQKLFSSSNDLSLFARLASAFFAGMGAAFIACPTEMVMTHQGKTKKNFLATSQSLTNQYSYKTLFAGLGATAMRDGMFTVCFLALTPWLKQQMSPWFANGYASSLLAGMSAGIVATATSHGFDTVKTLQQTGDLANPDTMIKTAKKLYAEAGMYGFFKGAIPRGTRVMSAVTIMGMVNEKMDACFAELNREKMVDENSSQQTELRS